MNEKEGERDKTTYDYMHIYVYNNHIHTYINSYDVFKLSLKNLLLLIKISNFHNNNNKNRLKK